MFDNLFLIFIGMAWIIAASIEDLKKREVANWLNYSLLITALSFRAFYSVLIWDYWPLLFGLLGFGTMVVVANALYYGRIFAGGDAKLLMALGAVLPISSSILGNLIIFGSFIFLLLFLGSFYGLGYSFFLAIKNRKEFMREFRKEMKKEKRLFAYSFIVFIAVLIFAIYSGEKIFLLFPALVAFFPFLFIYSKSIEEGCLIRKIKPENLALGDWLYEEVRVKGRTISPDWEGLNERDLRLLRHSRKEVYVKEGIPFVPAFLLAFIALMIINNYRVFILF